MRTVRRQLQSHLASSACFPTFPPTNVLPLRKRFDIAVRNPPKPRCDTPVFSREISQRGAAATECPRCGNGVRSRLGALSRRAERGDFVAHGGGEIEINARTASRQQSRTIPQKSTPCLSPRERENIIPVPDAPRCRPSHRVWLGHQ